MKGDRGMNTAKQIGDFSFKAATFACTPGQAGGVLIQANCEGTATGFGLTLGTMTVSRSGQSCGTWTWCATNFPDSGVSVTGTGQGTLSDLGSNRWRTHGLLTISDGRTCVVDGELDLATRSWNGRLFERS
ncbi:MAG: hypothetical protein ACT4PZ_11490 [Panacagrimonas sp.]